jgi:hypothetical protein
MLIVATLSIDTGGCGGSGSGDMGIGASTGSVHGSGGVAAVGGSGTSNGLGTIGTGKSSSGGTNDNGGCDVFDSFDRSRHD